MPLNENHIKLIYDDRDYADLKLAAAIDQSPNLKSFCTRVLLEHARRIIKDYQSQVQHAGLDPAGSAQ